MSTTEGELEPGQPAPLAQPLSQQAAPQQLQPQQAAPLPPAPPTTNERNVQNAVTFLTHPEAKNAPLPRKIDFLKHKGLNQQEIDEALRRAGINTVTNAPVPTTNQGAIVTRRSTYSWWEISALLLSFVTAIGALFKFYVLPWFEQRKQEEEARIKRLEDLATTTKQEVKTAVGELQLVLREMAESLRASSDDQRKSRLILEASHQAESKVRSLQAEISALRSSAAITSAASLPISTVPATETVALVQSPTLAIQAQDAGSSSDTAGKVRPKDKYVPGKTTASTTLPPRTISTPALGSQTVIALPKWMTEQPSQQTTSQEVEPQASTEPDLSASIGSEGVLDMSASSTASGNAPYSNSFVDIMSMVQHNNLPTDIQEINDLPVQPDAQVSSTAPPPLKPWERQAAATSSGQPQHEAQPHT
eukprot:c7704_g1_i1.p1 GENE.c7704_g1_i1~~c7704_g1_i1.p1  ORF type:complete len:432 (-),score=109.16 c7704_g1_i1:724-1983(-)